MFGKRHPLSKEEFLEGNRQRWAGIFTAIGLGVMLCTSYGWLKDPAPFLQFFLSIGVTFILGASASDVMKAWKVDSTTATQTLFQKTETTNDTTVDVNQNKTLTENVNEYIKEEGVNAPELRPFGQSAYGDDDWGQYKDFPQDETVIKVNE